MSDQQIWHIYKCCKCGRFVDGRTRQIVSKPEGQVMSHGYCDDCSPEVLKELEAEVAARNRARAQEILANRGIRYGLLCRKNNVGGEVK